MRERAGMMTIDFRDQAGLDSVQDRWSDPGDAMVVTQETIDQFADLSGDRNWIHVDVERCSKESPFGGPIAHGLLVLSLIPKIPSRESWVVSGHRQAINRGFNKIRFLRPVPAGCAIYSKWRLVSAKVAERGTDLVKEYQVFRSGETEPALSAEIVLRYA